MKYECIPVKSLLVKFLFIILSYLIYVFLWQNSGATDWSTETTNKHRDFSGQTYGLACKLSDMVPKYLNIFSFFSLLKNL
jgi:hypothetical protein